MTTAELRRTKRLLDRLDIPESLAEDLAVKLSDKEVARLIAWVGKAFANGTYQFVRTLLAMSVRARLEQLYSINDRGEVSTDECGDANG